MEFLALKLLLAIGIGAAIGLEREVHGKPFKSANEDVALHSVGVRTFALISMLGTLAGLTISSFFPFFLIITGAFFSLTLAYYILQSIQSKDNGFTTELSIFFTFLIGVFIAIDFLPLQLIFALVVMTIVLLSRKDDIRNLLVKINREEINAFVIFALVTLVILPFLPNSAFSISDMPAFEQFLSTYGIRLGEFAKVELFNPFRFWLIVVLITGIDMAGYLLTKLVGHNRGIILTSLVGGLVSSTATTQALANQSKASKNINSLVGAAILATGTSFLPIFVLIASVNPSFLVTLTPTLLSLLVASVMVGLSFFFFGRRNQPKRRKTKVKNKTESEIFSIGPALKFGVLFILVRIITQVSLLLFGDTGFLVSSALAGFTGIDASTLNISELAGKNIGVDLAILAFILVNTVNLSAKVFYSFIQGTRTFALKLGIGMIVIILCSLLGFTSLLF